MNGRQILILAKQESIYLDYINNYLTVEVMAEHYELSIDQMRALINKGKKANRILSNENNN